MAGLITYIIGGTGLFLIGASESIHSTNQTLTRPKSTPSLTTLISILFITNSLISITHAFKSHDQTGLVLQLEVISIAALFLLCSVITLLFQIPSHVINVLCLFGFVEEFLLFYIQKKDPDGIENRYYDLLLVPICVCIVSTVLELKSERSGFSRLGRGVGLVMQGMWFVQMGFSFYSGLITDGCFMKEKSRGNFTIRCKGHPEFHRARAIATLQFNCHLAVLVCLVAGGYSLVSRKYGVSDEALKYKPLGEEMQRVSHARFSLESDDDEEDGGGKDEGNVVVETGVNGYGSHH